MTRLLPAILALALSVAPAAAQTAEDKAEPGDMDRGFSLLEEGTKLVLRGLMDRMEPALDDLSGELGTALRELEPALRRLAELIDDIRLYEMPEILPNGDILIRRRQPLGPPLPPGGEIEL